MRIDRLELEGFRNYVREAADFDSRCNVICGENAQGKTNLLEALVYLSRGKSPRARTDREMIGFQADSARLLARVYSRDREFKVQADLFRGKRRKLTVNQVPVKTNAALGDVYHTVLFQPEDLFLIREGAAALRQAAEEPVHLPSRQILQGIRRGPIDPFPLAKAAFRQNPPVAQQNPFQGVLGFPALPPQLQQPPRRQGPQFVHVPHAEVSIRLAATTVTFSATMALSRPSSSMPLHWQSL